MPGIVSQRHLHALSVKQLFSNSLMCSAKILGLSFGEKLSMELIVLWLGPGIMEIGVILVLL